MFSQSIQDIRFAFRQLLKNPAFTVIAVLTLALGIGANTAIFGMINSVLIEPLPYPHAEQLVEIQETVPDGRPNGSDSGGAFKDWHEHNSSFANLAVYENIRGNLTGTDSPERLVGLKVSSEFFPVLGIVPTLGRPFAAGEDHVGGNARIVVLTHSLWLNRFGGDSGLIGKTVSLDQIPHTVVGVLPPNALLQDDVQFLIPEVIDAPGVNWGRSGHWRRVIGRLKPGVTAGAAQAELRQIKLQLTAQYPSWKEKWSVSVVSLQEIFAGDIRPRLLLLLGAVVLVLLIACANVSNLMLVRGSARSREMAIRVALGASSWAIIRQLLIESLLIAGSGCLAGLLLAVVCIKLLTDMVGGLLPQVMHPNLDRNVLGFSIAIAGGCGLLFGIVPAWRASRPDLNNTLKESERGSTSISKRRSQSLLVVSEVAFTLVLMIGAGLFLRSFVLLLGKDPGFNPKQTLAFDLSFPAAKYPKTEDRLHFVKELNARLAALPGVESVGATTSMPLGENGLTEMASRTDRQPRTDYIVACNYVGGDYFSAMGITLLRGRLIADADNQLKAPRVIVIDTGIARDLFANEDPMGHTLNWLGNTWEIIGIVKPVHQFVLNAEPRPTLYAAQAFSVPSTSIAIRSALSPQSLMETVRKTIQDVDRDQPVANIRTLEQAVHQSLATQRTTLILLGLFAGIAIGLACIGIYGVMSHAVGLQERELCIRSALGAKRRDIIQMVLAGGMKPSIAGIVVGLGAACALTRLLENQLLEVKARDPWVFVGSISFLAIVAALSVLIPAIRAANMDPMKALRHE